jgi:hypothetical protein
MPWTVCPGERRCSEPLPLVKAGAQLSAGYRCCPLLSPASCPRHAPRATVADRCLGHGGDMGGKGRTRLKPPARLVRNYAFCLIYPLFRRRYDPAVVSRTNEVPMKRFIGVAVGVAGLLLSFPSSRRATARPESAARPASPPPASTAARTPPATGSSSDLDLINSNGDGSYRGLLPLMRCSSRQ